MSFNWKLYVDLADELIKQKTPTLENAYLRSAISRSYYGIFGIAKNILISRGVNIERTDTHTFVRKKYQNSPQISEKAIGGNLNRLRIERNKADYENTGIFDATRAETAYTIATRTIELLDELTT